MKPLRLLTFLITAAIAAGTFSALAQDKTPSKWEANKAAKLKPLTDEQKQAIEAAVPAKATAKPKQARRILVFYRCETFVHSSIYHGNHAIAQLGEKTDAFKADFADTYDVFTAENLAKYDAIVLNNTTSLDFTDPARQKALLDFLGAGKGLAGIHAAADNFKSWPEGVAIMGGIFNGHPWTADGNYAFKVDDPYNTLTQSFKGEGFWHSDEIYQYNPESYQGTEKLRVLVSLDMSKAATADVLKNPKFEKFNAIYGGGKRDVPVSWCRRVKGGRLFYTNFGHNESTYSKPTMLQHYLDGIQYALGDLSADAKPTAKAGEIKPVLAPAK